MRQREFITLLGGAAAWPIASRAQPPERMRRIGVLLAAAADDAEFQARIGAFLQGLQQLGWTDGRNVRIDTRWATTNADDIRRHRGRISRARAGRHIGCYWHRNRGTVATGDPHRADRVRGGHRPGRRRFRREPGTAGRQRDRVHDFRIRHERKWLELLKEIAPRVTRAAVLRDPAVASGIGQFGAVQSVAPSLGVELSPIDVRDAPEIERAVTAFARSGNGGLIVTSSALASRYRDLIITLAAQHKLPAVYGGRWFVTAGGLLSYGPDYVDQFRQAAGYVDRILKCEKPADLPVQAPTKYDLVVNLKAAKALGLDVPETLLARADEVIE